MQHLFRIHFLAAIALLCASQNLTAQHFQGEIVYAITYESRIPGISNDSLAQLIGRNQSVYVISPDGYKTTYYMDDVEVYSYTYQKTTGRMFDYSVGDSFLTWRDSKMRTGPTYPVTLNRDTTLKILKRRCFLVHRKRPNGGYYDSWYSKKLRIDYANYINHHAGSWNQQLETTNGGLPLKTVAAFPNYTEISEAIVITKRVVSADEFNLPEDLPSAASGESVDSKPEVITDETTRDCYFRAVEEIKNRAEKGFPPGQYRFKLLVGADGTIKAKVHLAGEFEMSNKRLSPYYKLALGMIDICYNRFTPAMLNGQPIDCEFLLSIDFERMMRGE